MRGVKLRLLLFLCVTGNGLDIPTTTYNRLLCFEQDFTAGKLYDPTTEECENGTVVKLPPEKTTSSTISSFASIFHTTPNVAVLSSHPSPRVDTCVKPQDIPENRCYGQNLCGGFQCCGNNATYNPLTSTCCRKMYRIELFPGKPQRNHICCYQGQTTIHRRGTQPCLDPATNDKLLEKIKLKHMRKQFDCNLKHAYLVKDLKTTSLADLEFHGTIKLQQVYPSYINQTVFEKRVDFDKYSPIKPIEESSLLVLTAVDQTAPNRFRFFTYSNDQVYRIPFCSRRSKRLYNLILRCCYQGQTTIHRRGTQPCLDPATNDKLLEKIRLKHMRKQFDCNLKHAYLVKDMKTTSLDDLEFHGTIKLQQVYPSYINQTVFEKRVDFDKYSPIKPIEENSLLVLTPVDQTAPNRFRFFTYSNDQVYRIPFCSRRSKRLYNLILRQVLKNKC